MFSSTARSSTLRRRRPRRARRSGRRGCLRTGIRSASTTPNMVMPTPEWAIDLPQSARGRRVRRPRRWARPPRPVREPEVHRRPRDQPDRQTDADGRQHSLAGIHRPGQQTAGQPRGPARAGVRGPVGRDPPVSTAAIAPMGSATAAAKTKGVKAASKKGGPTDSVRSKNIVGDERPDRADERPRRSRPPVEGLFSTSPDSRLTVEKTPLASMLPARNAKSRSESAHEVARGWRGCKHPASGSLAKACTLVSTPERTMKVPISREAEGEDGQQDRPGFQGFALFHDDGRMQQGKPRSARA